MAKTGIIQREYKKQKLVEKYATKRASLKAIIGDVNSSAEEKLEAQFKLQKLPKNSSPSRLRSRCMLTGRPRGVYRKFGLSRTKLRELAMQGLIPGLKKSSW